MVGDVCPPCGAAQNRSFSCPPFAPHGEGSKALPVVRLATRKLLVSADAVAGLKPLATTLAYKHMATVLPNVVVIGCSQRLESLVTDITEVNHLSLSCSLSPHTDPIQQQLEFPHKPALDIFRSGCQQMSTPHQMFLKAYPSLEEI